MNGEYIHLDEITVGMTYYYKNNSQAVTNSNPKSIIF